jgi:hypothetical protein
MAKISINLYNLWIEVQSDTNYPDHISDISNRALNLFIEALEYAKKNNLDISKEYEEFGDEE